MSVVIEPFGNIGKYKVYQALLTSNKGHAISVLSFGGVLRRWLVPSADEKTINIVLGYNTLQHYVEDPFYMGAILGRVSNRIANRKFALNQKVYKLSKNRRKNKSPHHLHGGAIGLSRRLWEMHPDTKNNALRLTYHSPDGEDGYPGSVDFTVQYRLQGSSLHLEYEAKPSCDTPISLTQHYYFNLNGDGRAVRHIEEGVVRAVGGNCTNHVYQIMADRYLDTTDENVPTGKVIAVDGTQYDFRSPKNLRGLIKKPLDFDKHLLFSPGRNMYQPVAKAWGEKSNIAVSLTTCQVGMQFYNAVGLDSKYAAFCFEPQCHPNAINQKNFPSPIVPGGASYKQTCKFTVGIESLPGSGQ